MAGHPRVPIDTPEPAPAGPGRRTARTRAAPAYLLAAAASLVAWLLSYPLEPYVDRGDFPLFLGAVMLSA